MSHLTGREFIKAGVGAAVVATLPMSAAAAVSAPAYW